MAVKAVGVNFKAKAPNLKQLKNVVKEAPQPAAPTTVTTPQNPLTGVVKNAGTKLNKIG